MVSIAMITKCQNFGIHKNDCSKCPTPTKFLRSVSIQVQLNLELQVLSGYDSVCILQISINQSFSLIHEA